MPLKQFRKLWALFGSDPEAAVKLPRLRRLATRTFVWTLVYDIVRVAIVYPAKLFIDELGRPDPSLQVLLTWSGTILVIYLAELGLHFGMSCVRNAFGHELMEVLHGHSVLHQQLQEEAWQKRHSQGQKHTQATKSADKVGLLVDEILYNTLPVGIRIILTSAAMWLIAWPLGLVACLTLAIFAAMLIITDRYMRPLRKSYHEQNKAIEDRDTELKSNWPTIKDFNLERQMVGELLGLIRALYTAERRRHAVWIGWISAQMSIVVLSRAALYGTISVLAVNRQIGIGSVVLAISWMEMSYAHYHRFVELQHRMLEGGEALGELIKLWSRKPLVGQPDNPVLPAVRAGGIRLNRLCFRYGPELDWALRDIDLAIEPGSSIALVGASGSGKTTLARLIMRAYDAQLGCIKVDGVDLRRWDYGYYRRQMVAVVSQNVQLFNRSVLENIRIVRPNANDEEVIAAAHRADAHEFIMNLPSGYLTSIGENGVSLSGGQRQRLAIARAFLCNAKILILDEATSALDAEAQAEVQKDIDLLLERRECTVVIIAHRLSTVRGADRIATLEDGRITELGSHAELMEADGYYRRTYELETGYLA